MNKITTLKTFCTAALITWVSSSIALPGDSEQDIILHAERAELNQADGTAMYWEAVHIAQGSRNIWGDHAIFYRDTGGELTKAVMFGEPARFRYLPEPNDPEVIGTALIMEYHADTETMVLQGDAELEQDGNLYAAPRIEYNLAADIITSFPGDDKQRTRIVIHTEP